jgi:hypothetical protein
MGMELGRFLTQAGLCGGLRVRTVPVAVAFGSVVQGHSPAGGIEWVRQSVGVL